jgi:hypothetical protein
VTRYYRKAAAIEAVRWTGDNADEVFELAGCSNFDILGEEDRASSDDPECSAALLGGPHSTWAGVKDGQWIVKGADGCLRAFRDREFREAYELSPDELVTP